MPGDEVDDVPFDPAAVPDVRVVDAIPGDAACIGVPVSATGEVPEAIGLDRAQLEAAGFDATVGSTLVVPGEGAMRIAFGLGSDPTDAQRRDAASAFARAAPRDHSLVLWLPPTSATADVARSFVEGAILARYRYDWLRSSGVEAVPDLVVVAEEADRDEVERGARLGRAFAAATWTARDLANTPHSHLSATKLADLAVRLADDIGCGVEVFGKEQLIDMGCGGLLGVNAGSVEPPQMIKLTYEPAGDPTGHVTLVGKGIMYDSGGLSLKPGDEVHAQMKNDMSGAAAVFATFTQLAAVTCPTAVTAYLMCTDNMPSGTAMALGDVITIRGGATVEVVNTDAEGRLVMADALVLGTEEPTDAIIDIATLTGACMRALGTTVAGVMGTDRALVDRLRAAGDATDERVWELPLEGSYREQLKSTVADLKNLGGPNAGAITAGLFLRHFVGDVPWAHVDIAGTAQTAADRLWHTEGCSGFGARLLLRTLLDFEAA